MTAASADSARLRDFSDSLSPIVVKELRQALRGTGFIGQFCFIQAGLLLISLIQWHASETQQEQWDNAFWGACVTALVVLIPMRSFHALSAEMRSESFSLLQLTHMSAWKIVVGKWAATLALNALVVVTTIPFFVFRYFRGGVAIVSELIQLVMIACAGAMVVAFTVAFSAHRPFLIRAVLFAGVGVGSGLLTYAMILDQSLAGFSVLEVSLIFAGLICLGVYALLMGAGSIASGDENYVPAKRAFALLLLTGIAIADFCLDWDPAKEAPLEMAQCLIAIVFLLDSLSETPRFNKGIAGRLLRIPFVGKFGILRLLCYPGWQSGHVFLLPVIALFILGMVDFNDFEDGLSNVYFVLLGGLSMMFPTAVIQVNPKAGERPFFGKYLLIGVLVLVYGIFIMAIQGDDFYSEISGANFFAAVLTPFSAMLMGMRQWVNGMFDGEMREQSIFVVGTCVAMAWYLLVLLKGLVIIARIRAVEAVLRGEIASTQSPTAAVSLSTPDRNPE